LVERIFYNVGTLASVKEKPMKQIPAEKKAAIDVFLAEPLIARLATVDSGGQPHVVPVWYGWDGESLWISSFISTRKMGDLRHNPRISVAIDIAYGDNQNKAVIFEGAAAVISEPRDLVASQSEWIYKRYLGEQGVLAQSPQSWIVDPENRLIKLTPDRVVAWGF